MTAPLFTRGAPVSIVDVATDRAQYVTRVLDIGKTCVRVKVVAWVTMTSGGAPIPAHGSTWGLDGASGHIPGYGKRPSHFRADCNGLLRLRPWRAGDDEAAEVWALATALEGVSRERWEKAGAAHGLAVLRDIARAAGVAVKAEPKAAPAGAPAADEDSGGVNCGGERQGGNEQRSS
jgi:hypothetical protein